MYSHQEPERCNINLLRDFRHVRFPWASNIFEDKQNILGNLGAVKDQSKNFDKNRDV